jgi:hypothetical protein
MPDPNGSRNPNNNSKKDGDNNKDPLKKKNSNHGHVSKPVANDARDHLASPKLPP